MLTEFKYDIISGELCRGTVVIDACKADVIGIQTHRMWSEALLRYIDVKAFFFRYSGIEYGKIDMTHEQFGELCCEGCDDGGGPGQEGIYTHEYTHEFV